MTKGERTGPHWEATEKRAANWIGQARYWEWWNSKWSPPCATAHAIVRTLEQCLKRWWEIFPCRHRHHSIRCRRHLNALRPVGSRSQSHRRHQKPLVFNSGKQLECLHCADRSFVVALRAQSPQKPTASTKLELNLIFFVCAGIDYGLKTSTDNRRRRRKTTTL